MSRELARRRVVVSLDFELRWGVYDVYRDDVGGYRRNLEGVRDAVPGLLELFRTHGVRATWATVAALVCESWDEYEARAPAAPQYLDAAFAPVAGLRNLDPTGRLHFAPDLVRTVVEAPGQELGSHSFSHWFFGEAGFHRGDATRDAEAVRALFMDKFGLAPTSFVFPRNQVAFEDELIATGLRALRTNPRGLVWRLPASLRESPPARVVRLVQAFGGIQAARRLGPLVPASAFVRLGLPRPLFGAHLRAIAGAVRRCRPDEFVHLWFHPHNLGDAPEARLAELGELLSALRDEAPDLEFCTMADAVS